MTKIYIAISKKRGRGIFAAVDINKGEIIEANYTIYINKNDSDIIKKTNLWNYYFEFPDGTSRIVLGWGTIINHSLNPNVEKIWDSDPLYGDIVYFVALRDIKQHEELFHDYMFDAGTEPDWATE